LMSLLTKRRRSAASVSVSRVAGTALITVGTVVLSLSGSLNKRFGEMTAFAITLTIGVIVLFIGFFVSTIGPRKPDELT
jgi:low affinity Fe/Cu permease